MSVFRHLLIAAVAPLALIAAPAAEGAPETWYWLVDDFTVCSADLDADCKVGFSDLTMMLANWGLCPFAEEELLAVTSTCDLLELDTTSGLGTVIGNLGYDYANAMATDSQNRVFMTVVDLSEPGEPLVLVDPVTASGSVVATLSGLPPLTQTMALAFDSNDQLYALVGGQFVPGSLVRIDVANGSVEVVGETGYQQIWGMTFDAADTLYCVVHDEHALGTIDVETGQVTLIGAPGSLSVTDGLAFGAAGQLYAGSTTLVEIDPATGVETFVGSIGQNIQDLAAMHTSVPCPIDMDGSGDVGFSDLTSLLSAWALPVTEQGAGVRAARMQVGRARVA